MPLIRCFFPIILLFIGCAGIKPPTVEPDSVPVPTPVAQLATPDPELRGQAPGKPSRPNLEWETEASIPLADPSLLDDEELKDAASLLEQANEYYSASQVHWKNGDIEAAFSDLDKAYSFLLAIGSEEDKDILDEKENIRLLISKRTLELFAAQQRSVGDVQKSIPLPLNDYVKREIASFQGPERKFFLASYYRSGYYRPMILEALRAEGLPEQLSWLPLIESGFQPLAMSRARALGLWQFISSTGFRYGLERTQFIDERMEPVRATKAAIRYLQDLHSLFGDWLTALASYNCGEGRVLRLISSQQINYMDRFWDLYEKLPSETARYVPRFLATLMIIEDPGKYGIELPELPPAHEYELVQTNRPVSLKTLEQRLGLSERMLVQLNPELRLQMTPDKEHRLKVPLGISESFPAVLQELPLASTPPLSKPSTKVVRHKVRSKETLASISKKYGVSQSSLIRTNGLKKKARLKKGQILKIVVAQRDEDGEVAEAEKPDKTEKVVKAESSQYESKEEAEPEQANEAKTYRIRKGDTLWEVAKRYGVTVAQLQSWNRIGRSVHVGQTLKVSDPKGVASAEKAQPRQSERSLPKTYKVRKGDTLVKIAERHGVELASLMSINNLNKRSKIRPNQRLTIPGN